MWCYGSNQRPLHADQANYKMRYNPRPFCTFYFKKYFRRGSDKEDMRGKYKNV